MYPYLSKTRPKVGRTLSIVHSAGNDDRQSSPTSVTRASVEQLWPGIEREARRIGSLTSPVPYRPAYSQGEEERLTNWIVAVGGFIGAELLALMALCRGAGADSRIFRLAKGCHVYRLRDRLVLHDRSTRVHPVAVDPDWKRVVEVMAEEAGPDGFLFWPTNPRRAHPPLISDILALAGPVPVGVPEFDCDRMRSTWILDQLGQGADPRMLLRAAGIVGFTSLNDYVGYMEWLAGPAPGNSPMPGAS